MPSKPNIIFITSHDTGRHFGCYGIKELNTPNIDAMAADGVLLENLFCASPVCSPSRGAMMSGMYPQTNGMMGLVHPPNNWTYRAGVRHFSKIMQDTGYHTALFFHQHEVMPDKVASRLSFHEYLVPQGGSVSPMEVGAAVSDYVNSYKRDEPFYAQVGFGLTHTDWKSDGTQPDDEKGVHVPASLVDNEGTRKELAQLQGAVKHLDAAIGLILDGLAQSKHAGNTIVIYTVDHGLEIPRAKWHLYDKGIEVAFIIRAPGLGLTGGKRCGQLLSNVDVTPTLLELIGESIPAEMQGTSFADVLKDPDGASGREAVYAEYVGSPEARCVRTERYKLIMNFSDHRLLETPVDMMKPKKAVDRIDSARDRSFCPVVQLFDLEKDPLEFDNLYGRPEAADVQKDLERKLWQWLEDVKDPILEGPIQPISYKDAMAGYAAFKTGKA